MRQEHTCHKSIPQNSWAISMVEQSLKDKALRVLRDDIVSNRRTPGQPLNERSLSKELEISTTPIREALQLLYKEGFVHVIPRKGCFVSPLSLNDINDIMELRYGLEPIAASSAALKCTPEALKAFEMEYGELKEDLNQVGMRFHRFLAESTKNQRLIDIIGNLASHIDRINNVFIGLSPPNFWEMVFSEHKTIFDAIMARNSKQAEKAMRFHIKNYWKILKKSF